MWFSTESQFYDVYTMFAYRVVHSRYIMRMQNTGIDKMEEDGEIRIFCFLKHEAGFSCSSELDHLSHLIGSPLAPQILEMVDRISFKIYIECRDFFFFYCLLGPIKETKFMRLVIGSSDEFSFLFFFFRFIQFILVYVLKSFYLISSSVVLESKVLFFFFFFLFIINSFLYWMDLSKVFRLVFFHFI